MDLASLQDDSVTAVDPHQNHRLTEGQLLRKRKNRAQELVDSPQNPRADDEHDEHEEMSARKKARPVKKQAPNGGIKPVYRNGHVILKDENDNLSFSHMANYPSNNLRAIRTLEVHLDATKMDDFAEYRLSIALKELLPQADGTNPHNLKTIKIVVTGNVLFTRYSYHFVSPAGSQDVTESLKKLTTRGLTEQEKGRLPYKLNSTEKVIAKALLGIRGVRQVSIEGKGKMEGNFDSTSWHQLS